MYFNETYSKCPSLKDASRRNELPAVKKYKEKIVLIPSKYDYPNVSSGTNLKVARLSWH